MKVKNVTTVTLQLLMADQTYVLLKKCILEVGEQFQTLILALPVQMEPLLILKSPPEKLFAEMD